MLYNGVSSKQISVWKKKTIKKEIIKSAINIALLLSKTIYGLGVQTQAHAHTHIQYTIEAENEIVVK